jgi:flagellar motor switch protein FliN/FliY
MPKNEDNTGTQIGTAIATRALLETSMNLELPVQVVLGRTTLALEDVMRLSVGSVVDLRRSLSEPVEIVIRGRVIARGRLVEVDGKYGVEVISAAKDDSDSTIVPSGEPSEPAGE